MTQSCSFRGHTVRIFPHSDALFRSAVFAAVSLSLPKMRVRDQETETRLITTLRRTAEQISRDLAHAALAAARAKAEARGAEPGVRKPRKASDFGQNPRRRRLSGPGADQRDPQPLGLLMSRLTRVLRAIDPITEGAATMQDLPSPRAHSRSAAARSRRRAS